MSQFCRRRRRADTFLACAPFLGVWRRAVICTLIFFSPSKSLSVRSFMRKYGPIGSCEDDQGKVFSGTPLTDFWNPIKETKRVF